MSFSISSKTFSSKIRFQVSTTFKEERVILPIVIGSQPDLRIIPGMITVVAKRKETDLRPG